MKLDPSTRSTLLTLGLVGSVALLLSLVTVIPQGGNAPSTALVAADDAGFGGDEETAATEAAGAEGATAAGGAATSGGATTKQRASGPAGSGTGAAAGGAAAAATCAKGRNGGATDVGVTDDSVKLAATIVADGPGASFLGPVRIGMTTVVNRVNRSGGICGRKLDLTLRNDSWDADRGQQFIKNFVEGDKVFALAVVPSSEGLQAAKEYIAAKKVPVVGTDGMLIHQYRSEWIWPVATSTISTMHIMAKEAYDRGARQFGIVFDAKYHFGVEGAYAYNEAVKRLTGKDIPGFDPSLKTCQLRFCGIQPGKPTYAPEANRFNTDCWNPCDFVAILLEPDTAVSFLQEGRTKNPMYGVGGAQPLFNAEFAKNCRSICDEMVVWTGYNPPIEELASAPGVVKYVNEVKLESSSADVANQFLQGGYLGMSLLAEALTKTGPNLTRDNLKATLDSMTFDIGLSNPLSWRPGNHFANKSTQGFTIQYRGAFNGWRQKTSFLADPWVGQDIPAGQ